VYCARLCQCFCVWYIYLSIHSCIYTVSARWDMLLLELILCWTKKKRKEKKTLEDTSLKITWECYIVKIVKVRQKWQLYGAYEQQQQQCHKKVEYRNHLFYRFCNQICISSNFPFYSEEWIIIKKTASKLLYIEWHEL